MDDVWAVTTDDLSAEMSEARRWLPEVENCWRRYGVPSHPKKAVDEGEFEEIQGALLHPTRHVMGLAPDKLAALMVGALQVAICRRPARQSFERVVGKCSHVHCFRPCLRSSFQLVHRALHSARALRESRVRMTCAIQSELVEAALLLPFGRLDFQAPWARRVVCTDASPGGHGLAYASLDERTVVDWGRLASHRGDYTALLNEVGLEAAPVQHSHLKPAELPLGDVAWKLVGRPGQFEVIALEEYDAYLWGLESRLRHSLELGSRCIHIGDNSTHVGAEVKGRSSSFRLNLRCRRSCAIQVAGDLVPFVLWERSGRNPADLPSSWHGVRAGRLASQVRPPPGLLPPPPAADDSSVFVLLAGSPSVPESIVALLEDMLAASGLVATVCAVFGAGWEEGQLRSNGAFSALRSLCWSRRVMGICVCPPTSSWTLRCRHPARSLGVEGLRPGGKLRCDAESEWLVRANDLQEGVVRQNKIAVVLSDSSALSVAHSFLSSEMRRRYGGNVVQFDLCCFGARARRRVHVACLPRPLAMQDRPCRHRRHSEARQGRREPWPLAFLTAVLAELCCSLVTAEVPTKVIPRAPWFRGLAGLLPSGRLRLPRPQPVRDVWPLAPAVQLPFRPAAAGHHCEV